MPDPHAVLVVQMQAVLVRVAEWSRNHAGAPCPDAAVLGIAALDPWGHPIELTCTDQPGDQIMGAISVGPDGIPGNTDDVKSWNLGPGVTQLVQGPRWKSTLATKPPTTKRRRDTASTNDRILAMPRTGSTKPAGTPRTGSATPSTALAAPASTSPAATSSQTSPGPSIAPPAPTDAGDDIPTRR